MCVGAGVGAQVCVFLGTRVCTLECTCVHDMCMSMYVHHNSVRAYIYTIVFSHDICNSLLS